MSFASFQKTWSGCVECYLWLYGIIYFVRTSLHSLMFGYLVYCQIKTMPFCLDIASCVQCVRTCILRDVYNQLSSLMLGTDCFCNYSLAFIVIVCCQFDHVFSCLIIKSAYVC